MVTLRVFVFTFLTSWLAIAQNPDVHLRGTVETARSAIDLVLELRSARGPADGMSAIPGLAGQFDFPRLQPGLYVLTVKNHRDEILKSDYASVGASDADVTIRLGDAQPVEGRGTVNVNRLLHRTPKAAQKALIRYGKCHARHDEACEVLALNEAIAADPQSVVAYVNRSALHVRRQEWKLAVTDIDLALTLDPQCALAHANRAFVAIHQKEYQQASTSARAALRSEPDNLSAQYLLGLAQVNLGDAQNGFRLLDKM